MKKVMCALLAMLIMTGCSKNGEEAPENGVLINGIAVSIDHNFNEIKNHLGNVLTVSTQPSCMYSGDEKVYSYQSFDIQTYPDGSNEKVESVTVRTPDCIVPGSIQVGDDINLLEQELSNVEFKKTPRIWFYEKKGFGIRYFYEADSMISAIEIYKIMEGS